MSEKIYTVAGMTCAHCAASVTREVSTLAGVDEVQVDVAAGTVTVSATGALTDAAVADAVEAAGYTLTGSR